MEFQIEVRGRDYWAQTGKEEPFFVGRRMRYGTRLGLSNIFGGSPLTPLAYQAENYVPDFGIWAQIIAPTAACEGGSFLALNSYDRAGFTFGVTQFAAHVPNGDFVRLLRVLLARPEAADYFPMLRLINGQIHLAATGSVQPLEGPDSTAALMAWLNPSGDAIEAAEIEAAARLIHWTQRSRAARLAQIAQTIASFTAYLRRAGRKVPMEGRAATHCCILADLLHHGRGGRQVWAAISQALAAADPLDAMLAIGGASWPERVDTLRREIAARPDLSRWRWSVTQSGFVQ